MKSLKEFIRSCGLFYKVQHGLPYELNSTDYQVNSLEKLELHRGFIVSLEQVEGDRLSLIESKTSQLISQTGIIFSLLGVFIPIFIDKVSEQPVFIRLILLMILVFAFSFYVLTIINAIKNYNVNRFRYMRPAATNIINHQNNSVTDFLAIEIRDRLDSLNNNIKVNNIKATHLLHSYSSFKAANILTALLFTSICILLLFLKPEDNKIRIEPIEIQNIDSAINELNKAILNQDTVIINFNPVIVINDSIK